MRKFYLKLKSKKRMGKDNSSGKKDDIRDIKKRQAIGGF
jgi:hypothetical protein